LNKGSRSLGLVTCEHGRHCLEYGIVPDQLVEKNRCDMHQDECEEGKGQTVMCTPQQGIGSLDQ
jgi:hypothetical protein